MDAVLVLDVDGVVSPNDAVRPHMDRPGTGGWTDWRTPRLRPRGPDGRKFYLKLSATMGQALAELDADVRWLTSWDGQALFYVGAQLGLRHATHIPWPNPGSDRSRDHAKKAEGLADCLDHGEWATGRWSRLVWVDDELRSGGRLDFATTGAPDPLEDRGIEHLKVGVDPAEGLSVSRLREIEDWLARS